MVIAAIAALSSIDFAILLSSIGYALRPKVQSIRDGSYSELTRDEEISIMDAIASNISFDATEKSFSGTVGINGELIDENGDVITEEEWIRRIKDATPKFADLNSATEGFNSYIAQYGTAQPTGPNGRCEDLRRQISRGTDVKRSLSIVSITEWQAVYKMLDIITESLNKAISEFTSNCGPTEESKEINSWRQYDAFKRRALNEGYTQRGPSVTRSTLDRAIQNGGVKFRLNHINRTFILDYT